MYSAHICSLAFRPANTAAISWFSICIPLYIQNWNHVLLSAFSPCRISLCGPYTMNINIHPILEHHPPPLIAISIFLLSSANFTSQLLIESILLSSFLPVSAYLSWHYLFFWTTVSSSLNPFLGILLLSPIQSVAHPAFRVNFQNRNLTFHSPHTIVLKSVNGFPLPLTADLSSVSLPGLVWPGSPWLQLPFSLVLKHFLPHSELLTLSSHSASGPLLRVSPLPGALVPVSPCP